MRNLNTLLDELVEAAERLGKSTFRGTVAEWRAAEAEVARLKAKIIEGVSA